MMEAQQQHVQFVGARRAGGIGGGEMNAISPRSPDVQLAIDELERQSAELFELANALAERLSPVLAGNAAVNKQDRPATPSNCAMSGRLRNIGETMASHVAILAAILQSLQI